jgi:hypothetical protein
VVLAKLRGKFEIGKRGVSPSGSDFLRLVGLVLGFIL